MGRIIVGNQAFRVHRTVLAAGSPALARLFGTVVDNGALTLSNTVPRAVARVLQFLYCHRFPQEQLDLDELAYLATLARDLEIEPLRRHCLASLRAAITLDNHDYIKR